MKVEYCDLMLPIADLGGENPLPVFRDEQYDVEIAHDESFTPEEAEGLGKSCGRRVLPYLMQDRYNRIKQKRSTPVVVLENDYLKAVFLCDFGGRLYSLYDKENERELLFKNPVIQPANLAIRDAWLSGGIEWNIGQVGHTFTTCSPVFCARVDGKDGEKFLRIYEYERQKKLFWQIDFHLPDDSRELFAYVRIINDNPTDTPMYWWTNIAVTEDASTRVLSNAERAMYSNPNTGKASMGKMPYFPEFGAKDYSYTLNMKVSNDFFLQTEKRQVTPWEAVAYGNGDVTFEKSTSPLHYRKVFCWGDRPGGQRWKEFLSEDGGGSYIEIQAGIGRSQRHGFSMPAKTVWEFTEAFGGVHGEAEKLHGKNWQAACEYTNDLISSRVSVAKLYGLNGRYSTLANNEPETLLHLGSGWGALERAMRSRSGEKMPLGIPFPAESVGAEQKYWLELAVRGALPDTAPLSYMTDEKWQKIVSSSPDSWQKFYQLGVFAAELPDRAKAREYFAKSVEQKANIWALRALAVLSGDFEESESYYAEAMKLGFTDVSFAQEYLKLLVNMKKYEKAVKVFSSLPKEYRDDERVMICAVSATLALGDYSLCENGFFDRNFVNIKEGEIVLSDLWYYYTALKAAKDRNIKITPQFIDWVKANSTLPKNIDFRMK